MTTLEIKKTLEEKCKEEWSTHTLYERTLGADHIMTEKSLTRWVTLLELYKELFGENLI